MSTPPRRPAMLAALATAALALFFPFDAAASHRLLVGLAPMVSYEPADGSREGAFDLNVLPLALELKLTRHVGLKAINILNYQVGGERDGFSQRGAFVGVPVYLSGFDDGEPARGPWLGPLIGLASNPLDRNTDLTMTIDAGWAFAITDRFSVHLGLQAGATRIGRWDGAPIWTSHLGLFPTFGIWI